jgi:cyclopropane fatty-acyl-phospholipid synthase-like methyltransferase
MTDLANQNISKANLSNRIRVEQSYFADITERFNCVISSGTLHHSHDPLSFWSCIKRIAQGRVFVMDLIRPNSELMVDYIVNTLASGESNTFKTDFVNSLKAAFTLEEIQQQLDTLGLSFTVTVKGDPSFVQIAIIHGNNNVNSNN